MVAGPPRVRAGQAGLDFNVVQLAPLVNGRRAKNARVLPGLGLSGVKDQDDDALSARLDEWLRGIDAPGAAP